MCMSPATATQVSDDPPAPPPILGRQTLRCLSCDLVQFVTASNLCRRCHKDLTTVVEIVNPTPPVAPNPYPHHDAPVFVNLRRTLPVVVCWLRLRIGLSQKDLAIRMGHGGGVRTWISKVENGQILPTVNSLERLAIELGVDGAKLMKMCEFLQASDD